MFDLDELTAYGERDPGRMHGLIGELGTQCRDAWALTQGLELPERHRKADRVAVLGMGGSAIGGALLAGLVGAECSLPISSVGGYDLPAHVDPTTLVIASSYSGNTEETLSALAQAGERGCPLVAVTTGGKLAEQAAEKGIPLLRFSYVAPPRAVVGYSFTLLLGLFCRLGFLRDYEPDLMEAVAVLAAWQEELNPQTPTSRNLAKQMAERLLGRLSVTYGAGFLAPVARRWKGQFNENAKHWAFWEEMPELNHNAVVGYGNPERVREGTSVCMLRSPLDHPRVQARWDVTQELLLQAGASVDEVWGRGESHLAQMLSLIHLGDYVSLYLALLNGVDPTPVASIDVLKRRLAELA